MEKNKLLEALKAPNTERVLISRPPDGRFVIQIINQQHQIITFQSNGMSFVRNDRGTL